MGNELKNIDIDKTMSTVNRASETIEFAGFLTNEEEDTLYISDAQGTWMIPRKEVVMIEDWEVPASLKSLRDTGKPVRLVMRKGSTIYEIRPWHFDNSNSGEIYLAKMEEKMQKIFTAGNPSSTKMMDKGQLIELEKLFLRKLGWNPNDYSTPFLLREGSSLIIEIYNDDFSIRWRDEDF